MLHPTNAELLDFAAFAHDSARMLEIDAHLDGCPECSARHAELARNAFFLEHEFTLANLAAAESQARAGQALQQAASRWGAPFVEWARKAQSIFVADWTPLWRPAYRGPEGMLVLNAKRPAAALRVEPGPSGASIRVHADKSCVGRTILLVRVESNGELKLSRQTAGARSPRATFDVEPGFYLVLLEPGA